MDSVPSTNDYLRQQIANSKPLAEGTAIMANYQTHGRGQRNNAWLSEKGKNLTFSYYLVPSFLNTTQQFYLTVFTSIAVARWLQQYTEHVTIKWPNDIMVGKNKIAGILIENTIRGTQLQQSIIGIGININQQDFKSTPKPITSLKNATQAVSDFDLRSTLREIFKYLSEEYYNIQTGEYEDALKRYNKLLFQKGEEMTYIANNEKIKATLEDVQEDGLARLRIYGATRLFNVKEFEYFIR